MTANELLALVVPGDRVDGLVDDRTAGSEGSVSRQGAKKKPLRFLVRLHSGCALALCTDGLEGDDEAWPLTLKRLVQHEYIY